VSAFAELRQELTAYLEKEQIDIIYQAYRLAKSAHKGQKRHSGDDYISHPVAVARILAEMHMDPTTIMAGLLHDVIEDTNISKQTITEQFGEAVAQLVDGVSKLTQIKFETRAEAQAENFRKMVLAMANDIRVIIVKLSDRLHNMRTLDACPPEKRRRMAMQTLDIYAPIANRLGMHSFRVEFEERGFAAMFPMRHRILSEAIRKISGNRKEILIDIESTLKQSLIKHGLPVDAVWGREKHIYSIYKKMRKKHLSFSEVMDVYAFRIVVDSIDTCYRTLGVVHNLYKPVPERFKDYIAIPKANGYQSLHTTLFGPYGVPIEVQIRDQEMEDLANNGIAAHWLYKSKAKVANDAQIRARNWLQKLLEMQKKAGSSLEFVEHVKFDLFPDEVYVFTPKGDIKELPNGASAVDFAYAIHSDVGNTTVAAKIDHRLAPLSTQLANGQRVEIITAPGARPNPAWLNFVVTGKARSNIRHFLKNQRSAESIQFGKRLLDRALATLSTQWDDLKPENISKTLTEHSYQQAENLFEAIGLGNEMAPVIAAQLVEHDGRARPQMTANSQPLSIKGSEGMIVHYAHCCRPIPGDPIVGIIQAGRGINIHMETCHKVEKFRGKPSKCIDLQWASGINEEFQASLFLLVLNRRGTLGRLANDISNVDADIINISVDEHEGNYNIINLIVGVRDRKHLANLLRRLRHNREVMRLNRNKPNWNNDDYQPLFP
jgi:GTP diphosphokinase / guanosine-3',5'-bis(diphosphate) 3'-diphosphatase